MAIESGDQVSLEYVGRLDDGVVFDTSREEVADEVGITAEQPDREFTPLTVEVGSGRIIEGLEEALIGLEEGETETVTIPPEKAYGEPQDDHVQEYEAAGFNQMLQGHQATEGMHVRTEDGTLGEVVHVDDEAVRVDFNHELAGETLTFEVEIVDIQK